MRVLVSGAAGMLGRDVVVAARLREHEVIALTREDLDVTDAPAVRAAIASEHPEAIVNCAAWTDVDGAETAEEEALKLNGTAPGVLAQAASERGAQLIHLSSDYVFDGSARRPYVESDSTAPRSAYGRTKLAGEQAVLAAGPEHAIVRTAWLFGAGGGRNFVATMLTLAGEGRDELAVVSDQRGCPTFSGHLASALVSIAERRLAGVAHIAGGGHCAWSELARETFAQAGVSCIVRDVGSSEFPRAAQRPAWSVLASERSEVPRLARWQDGLAAYLAEVREGLAR
jgi:dTDP-4-dehydrorhamnose reductase